MIQKLLPKTLEMFMYYNGMEGGAALAEAIIGDIAPVGHLPETFYKKAQDCSAVSIGDCGDDMAVVYRFVSCYNLST